jgi:hypothetical protein
MDNSQLIENGWYAGVAENNPTLKSQNMTAARLGVFGHTSLGL